MVGFGALTLGGLLALGTISVFAASPDPSPSAGASAAPSPGASPGAAALPGNPQNGQQVYNQNCTACHGASLEGGVGPRLNPLQKLAGMPSGAVGDPPVVAYMIDVITNGRPRSEGFTADMPAWGGKLSPQQIKDVTALIIQTNQTSAGGTLSPQDLARSNVFWVTVGISAMVVITYLLARYNMRWIGRRAGGRQEL
jgi:mono/diheme cytochrome c family protein